MNMIQKVFQRVKTSDFVTYRQAGAPYHNPIMIVFSYRFLTPPEKLFPQKGYFGNFLKITNFPKMVLECS